MMGFVPTLTFGAAAGCAVHFLENSYTKNSNKDYLTAAIAGVAIAALAYVGGTFAAVSMLVAGAASLLYYTPNASFAEASRAAMVAGSIATLITVLI